MSGSRRLLLSMAAVGLAGVVAAAGWFASSALPVATGHKAKALCSSIDVDARTVTTRALGVERRAI